ncbi:MAG: ATP synthase subunit I [Candidatus Binataceae bacterium]
MIRLIVLHTAPYVALGVLIGVGYFAALGWNVRLYAGHGAGWRALLFHLSRLAVAVVAFTLCAKQGAAPLLASFAGFLAARAVSINHYRVALRRNP